MFGKWDRCYCCAEDCLNMECDRHPSIVAKAAKESGESIVTSYSDFSVDCKNYITKDNSGRINCMKCFHFPVCENYANDLGWKDKECEHYVKFFNAPQVVKGEWIADDDGDGMHCSVCKTDFCYSVCGFVDFNFCPNCGADMRGKKND